MRKLEWDSFVYMCTHLFIGCDGASLLRGLFSSGGRRELLFVVLCGLRTAVASLQGTGLWDTRFGNTVLEHRLNSVALGSVALWHVGSSWIGDPAHASCIDRWLPSNPEPPGKPLRLNSKTWHTAGPCSPGLPSSVSSVLAVSSASPHKALLWGQAQPPPTAKSSVTEADVLGCQSCRKGVWDSPDSWADDSYPLSAPCFPGLHLPPPPWFCLSTAGGPGEDPLYPGHASSC